MAAGDTKWFADYWKLVCDNTIGVNFSSGPGISCALIKGAADGGLDPTGLEPYPTWSAMGTTDMRAYEVTPGGDYNLYGNDCFNVTVTRNNFIIEIDWGDPQAWEQDPSNPDNARWAIFYNTGDTNCVAYYDLGGVIDMTTGKLQLLMPSPVLSISVAN